MTPSRQHEVDFYSWTQEQTALIRALPRNSNGLDIENIAEEIEGLGRAEIREVESSLLRTLVRLIRIAVDRDARSVSHWVDEANGFQAQAVLAFSPGLRQRLDIPKVWMLAKRNAKVSLAEYGAGLPALSDECPVSLDHLLADDFSPREAAAVIMDTLKLDDAAHDCRI